MRFTVHETKGSQPDAVIVPLPFGQTELCPMRALRVSLEAGRRIWLPKLARPDVPQGGGPSPGVAPPLPRIGDQPVTPWAMAANVKSRAANAGLKGRTFAATASSAAP
jgi:hypothetical protein